MSPPRTVRSMLALGISRLQMAGIDSPARDARALMAAALGVDPGRITLLIEDPLPDPSAFLALIQRRAAHEPVSKILGERAFYGRSFAISRDVLDPRPDTETLIDIALAEPFSSVLDLGTGSGCILLTLLAERAEARGLGTDLSPAALAIAAKNAKRLGLTERATFAEGSWFEAAPGRFDLIVSNPPYIASAEMPGLSPEVRLYDPEGALTDYGDGLGAYRSITAEAMNHLSPGGRLVVEIGWQQGAAVSALFQAAGFAEVSLHPDIDGRDRVVFGRAPA